MFCGVRWGCKHNVLDHAGADGNWQIEGFFYSLNVKAARHAACAAKRHSAAAYPCRAKCYGSFDDAKEPRFIILDLKHGDAFQLIESQGTQFVDFVGSYSKGWVYKYLVPSPIREHL